MKNSFITFFSSVWNFIKKSAISVWSFAGKHRIASVLVVIVLIGGGYWGYTALAANAAGTQYVLARVTQAPLTVTVTGSGQVSAQDTLNLTPQASGQITYLNATPGQTVTAGTLIAELDMTTAAEAVTTARQNLKSAEISYQQTLASSGSTVTNDQTSVQTAENNNLTTLATTYSNLPGVMTGLDGVLHNLSTLNSYTAQQNIDAYANFLNTPESHTYRDQVVQDYAAALSAYQNVKAEYDALDQSSATIDQVERLNQDTLASDSTIETALKDTLAYYNYVNDQVVSSKVNAPPQLATQLSSLNTYQTTVTGDDSSITSAQTALTTAQQSVDQDTQSLNDSGTPLTVQAAELNVQKAQESLTEALTNEADYEVRAPFSGTIGTVPVNKYDQASSGTTIATLITTDEYVDLSLNETDAAKVVVGQPATITFDALPNLTMTGNVAVINPIGTISSGVVTYDVKVSFTQQNPEIKPGMTATAVITTASEPNAIQVPSAAIKTSGNSTTVQVATLLNASSTMAKLASGTKGGAGAYAGARRSRTASSTASVAGGASTSGAFPSSSFASSSANGAGAMSATTALTTRSLTVPASEVTIKTVPVTVGLSNDTMTEVLTGLTPGELVVTATQTATAATKTAAASATSLLGGSTSGRGSALGGLTGGGGYGGGTGGTRAGGGATGAGAGR